MKNSLLIIAILLSFIQLKCQETRLNHDKRLIGVDQEIESLLKDYKAAGLAIAIVENNKVIYTKGFGYRDYNKKLPVTENTIFGIGSMTKSFTAALLGIQKDKKKFDFDNSPKDYIPELKFFTPKMNNSVTVKDLLTHRTGLPGLDGSFVLFESEDKNKLIPRLEFIEPIAKVGERPIYNNANYIIAGVISERLTGLSWEENITDLIFKPLGMTNSKVSISDVEQNINFSYGYGTNGKEINKVLFEDMPTTRPAGGIYSSAKDMSKWMTIWLNDGKYKGVPVLSSDYINEATSAHQIINGNPPKNKNDEFLICGGYGWLVNSYEGFYKVNHGGNVSGFSSSNLFLPSEKIGIVVLTNQTLSNLPNVLEKLLLHRMLNLKTEIDKKPSVTPIGKFQSSNIKTTINEDKKPSHSIDCLIGTYLHPGYGRFEISFQNETLFAKFPFTTFRLKHKYYDVFGADFVKEIPIIMGPFLKFSFVTDFGGKISGVKINLQETPVEFKRIVEDGE